MTLIISEASKHGIVMAADSAITEVFPSDWTVLSGETAEDVIRTGAQKIQPIFAIDAAVGFWGDIASIGTPSNKYAQIPLDVFISDFAKSVQKTDSLEYTGHRLSNAINDRIHIGDVRGGFHICGFSTYHDKRVPAIFHAHTGDRSGPQGPLLLRKDFPFCEIDQRTSQYYPTDEVIRRIELGEIFYRRNGDIEVYAHFQSYLSEMMYTLASGESGFICPSDDRFENPLEVRGHYLALQISTICDFYKLSNMLGSIAKPVSWLTISQDGIEQFVRVDE